MAEFERLVDSPKNSRIDVQELVDRASFENRVASTMVDGKRATIQARVGDSKFGGEPYLVATCKGNHKYQRFNSVEEMVDEFEQMKDDYGAEESTY